MEKKYYIAVLMMMLLAGAYAYTNFFNGSTPPPPPPDGDGSPPPSSGLWLEIAEDGEAAWQLMEPLEENGMTPAYDEYTSTATTVGYPDTIMLVYLYLVDGKTEYLDLACEGLRNAVDMLINPYGVMMAYDFNTHSKSASKTIRPSDLADYIEASCYIVELKVGMTSYLYKLADAALKFQQETGLYVFSINYDGSPASDRDDKGSRELAAALLRVYKLTGQTRYRDSALKMIDALWSFRVNRAGSPYLIDDNYDVHTGEPLFGTTRCHCQWQFVSLLDYAYHLTGNSKYADWLEKAKSGLYNVFWLGDKWNYRTTFNLWELYQPTVIVDTWAMNIYQQEGLIDIKKRVIDGFEFSSLDLIMHAVDNNGNVAYNSNDNVGTQMSSSLAAWGYGCFTGDTQGYTRALTLYRALIKYHKKSHGYINGVEARSGDFYHKWSTDYSRLSNVVFVWYAIPLLFQPNGVTVDFGEGCPMPYRHGDAYGPPKMDLQKIRVNMQERYIKLTVQGTGSISFQTGLNIQSCKKNGFSYSNFSGNTLTVDSSGIYEVWF